MESNLNEEMMQRIERQMARAGNKDVIIECNYDPDYCHPHALIYNKMRNSYEFKEMYEDET